MWGLWFLGHLNVLVCKIKEIIDQNQAMTQNHQKKQDMEQVAHSHLENMANKMLMRQQVLKL